MLFYLLFYFSLFLINSNSMGRYIPQQCSRFLLCILVPVLSVLLLLRETYFTMFLFRLWNRTNEHLVTYLNLCLQVVFLTCEIYIGLYNLCNFNVAISVILIVELMIDVVIGLKLFHNQSI